ncbi:MAG: hypothetical protein KJ018_15725 [Burkholderiales bacterium]|nr:hypothetical protein [Burkholderiales bacterium]GIK85468.1 MAG: hypothetical protein BroJett026_09490 [Betaproteobacteria bacterium]
MATGGNFILGKDNIADRVTYVSLLKGKFPEKTYAFRAQAGNPNSHGMRGDGSGTGLGVHGVSTASGAGVRGHSALGAGVHGLSDGQDGSASIGVYGEATKGGGTAMRAKAKSGAALYATSDNWAIFGRGGSAGVEGLTLKSGGIGVWGHVMASNALAAKFEGPVVVKGDFTVTNGVKSAAVPLADGTLRRLYCMESPESWFEDFGEGRLVRGRAEIRLARDFAAVVAGNYHVFVTPHGDSNGLYVAARRRASFTVREQGAGTGTLAFSYRVVARRRDVDAPRMAKVRIPDSPRSASLEEVAPPRRR